MQLSAREARQGQAMRDRQLAADRLDLGDLLRGENPADGLNGTVSSGPSDNWLTPDGAYLHQLYGNASKLIGYRTQPDGSLEEVTSATIPYNSSQGLAGF